MWRKNLDKHVRRLPRKSLSGLDLHKPPTDAEAKQTLGETIMATFEPVLVGQIKSTGYTNFFNQLGANILNVKAGAYIAAGWNAPINSRDQGLIFENPVNTLALPFANKGTWTVNIDGGVVSYNDTGLIFWCGVGDKRTTPL